ncbi:unnamed protein product [Candidula unifasciata]|uniref:Chitin-binding type-4 domain-containing protein n=1 Tax=Candidula unifasciata TaxID=100452 RepID=A0A8S3YV45_9EUPU|nr:unnamed protein product [Candidula unifasciata]
MEHALPRLGLVFIALTLIQRSEGHGYMIEPPGRSSMWRKGFKTPINYDDNGVRCAITEKNCRVCGNRDNEAGGRYATGQLLELIPKTISITVTITVNHKGYFEFSLCPNNNVHRTVTDECLQRHILQLEDGQTRFQLKSGVTGDITIKAKLPPGVTCSQCVLRWFYKTGNSWGYDPVTKESCLGCGVQERFFSCADVSIVPARHQFADPLPQSDQTLGDLSPPSDYENRVEISQEDNKDRTAAEVWATGLPPADED